jgi:hypothetical protein
MLQLPHQPRAALIGRQGRYGKRQCLVLEERLHDFSRTVIDGRWRVGVVERDQFSARTYPVDALVTHDRINHVFIWSGSCTEANLTQAVRNDGTAPGSVDSKG